ncbi:hypothetical protein GIB67_002127 [Kingdonia uniflora]|uniref:Uncharacterized protein n=1 Tax=Kingdonia uniflora TaxID=39325 RepID=A0A7J7KWJ4_9MAGN|nr:hypothetical protein GIB67_002127 [Kingdonia uniflora]
MMSTLVVEIFDRHLSDMKFQFGETIIQMKPIHVCLILWLNVSPIANEFLFVDPEYMTNFIMRRFPKKKNTYRLKEIDDALKQAKFERHKAMKPSETDMQQDLVQEVMRHQIEVLAMGAPAVSAPAVIAPAIGSSSSTTEIGVAVRVCSQLEEHGKMLLKLDDHGKMLHNYGKMLERILMFTVGGSTLPLGDALLLELYQFSPTEKTTKHKRERGNKKEDGKRKKAELRIKKEFPELKNIQSTTQNLLQQVAPGEILEVVNDLMVDDDVEVGRKVNFNAIPSEYGGDLLEWKKGDKKDNDDKKDVEEKVKSEEKQPQVAKDDEMEESKNYDEKVDNIDKDGEEKESEEEDSKQPTVVVYYTRKKMYNMTMRLKKSKEEVEQNKEEVFEDKDDDNGNLQNKPDLEKVIKQMVVDQTNLVLMKSEVDVTLNKRHTLNEEEINERAVKMACQMNRLHAHLDELLPGVLLEYFIQRPIYQDEKNHVDQVWSLRKDGLSPEAKKDNSNTYMRIGEETVCFNALYTLYPNQWLDNEVIDVYIKP